MKSLTKIVIGLAIGALISTAIVYALFPYQFPQYATVAGREEIMVYEDEDLTIQLRSLNWTTVNTGNNTRVVYVKNIGTLEVTLGFTATPPLNWREICVFGTPTLLPDEATTATLTLTVPRTALAGAYSWPSQINATAI